MDYGGLMVPWALLRTIRMLGLAQRLVTKKGTYATTISDIWTNHSRPPPKLTPLCARPPLSLSLAKVQIVAVGIMIPQFDPLCLRVPNYLGLPSPQLPHSTLLSLSISPVSLIITMRRL